MLRNVRKGSLAAVERSAARLGIVRSALEPDIESTDRPLAQVGHQRTKCSAANKGGYSACNFWEPSDPLPCAPSSSGRGTASPSRSPPRGRCRQGGIRRTWNKSADI